jgi:sulfate adenylyltransferase large subunit
MATGASTAELAIILCDAARGLTIQSRRHAYIAALLGIPHFVIAVNKMDLVAYNEDVFREIRAEFEPFLHKVGARDPYFLPLSALKGDNVVDPSRNMPWFNGPSLLEHLETVETFNRSIESPFRMAVQRVVRPNQNFRGYAGQIASGVIRPGDEVLALPSGRHTHVRRIVTFDGDVKVAHAPLSVTLTLEDEIDISRGDMIAGGDAPAKTRAFEATMVWFDGRPLNRMHDYLVKHTAHIVPARVEEVKHRVNVDTLETGHATGLSMNEIGVVRIATAKPLFFDRYGDNRGTGSFILIDRETNATAGAGMILTSVEDAVENPADRVARLVRGLVPADAKLNLPENESAALDELRQRLQGLW